MAQMQVATAGVTPPPLIRHRLAPLPTPPATRVASNDYEPRTITRLGVADSQAIVQSILDSIQVGAMAVGTGLRVAFANRAAVRECSRRALMRAENAQMAVLALPDPTDRQRLAQAVELAHRGQWSLVRLGSGSGTLSIAVFPLCASERGTGPLALLLFQLSDKREPLATQLYAKSCGLTPAETRVLLGLADGLLPKQIASKHEVLLSTVRTQISSIRDKTGTRRLADLLQALVSLPPIMPNSMGNT